MLLSISVGGKILITAKTTTGGFYKWLKSRKVVKLQIPAGKATPAPPVGPALGQAGINIMGFTKEFNARTADQAGMIIPVVISVYEDKSFDFVTKTPPAAVLLKKLQVLKKVQEHLTQLKLQQLLVHKYKKLLKLKCQT